MVRRAGPKLSQLWAAFRKPAISLPPWVWKLTPRTEGSDVALPLSAGLPQTLHQRRPDLPLQHLAEFRAREVWPDLDLLRRVDAFDLRLAETDDAVGVRRLVGVKPDDRRHPFSPLVVPEAEDRTVKNIGAPKQRLSRAVDQQGYVLDEIVQIHRNTKARSVC